MGRIRTKDIKDLSRDLQSVYSDRFSPDFEENKTTIAELKIMEGKSKRFRNKVAGYIVRLARQAEHGHHATGERAPEAENVKEESFEEEIEAKEEAKEEVEEAKAESNEAAEKKETAEETKEEPKEVAKQEEASE